MDMNMTLNEMIEDYYENKHKVMETDLASGDNSVAMDYNYELQLLHRAANALEFAAASIPVIYNDETSETKVETLMEQKQALEKLRCLSNNMDSSFIYSMYCENNLRNTSSETMSIQQKKATAIQDKLDLMMDIASFKTAYANCASAALPVSVAELEQAINDAEALMVQYNITEDDISGRTTQVVADKYQKKELYVFQDINSYEEEQQLTSNDLEIVESNDGYVMATNASPELFAQNPSLERDFSERVRGNEIVHSEPPRETTIDMAKVGGNVKYEQYDDIGTVEKQQGVPTYEEKTEMSERTERETSGNGKSSTTTTTKTTKTETYER